MASAGAGSPGTAGATRHTDELLFWLGEDVEEDVVPDRVVEPVITAAPEPRPVEAPTSHSVSTTTPRKAAPASPATGVNRRRRLATLLGVVAAGAVVFGVYSAGKPDVPAFNGKADEAASSQQGQLDQSRVADLMKKISANSRDVTALQALADLYFQAGDYKTASTWERKVLAIQPKNVTALLGLGAAQFNLGNSAEAEKDWLLVTTLDPRKAEAHYDLGFLYLSKTPPNMAKVRSEWQQVVAIDPTSDIAKTVAQHLKSLDKVPATSGK